MKCRVVFWEMLEAKARSRATGHLTSQTFREEEQRGKCLSGNFTAKLKHSSHRSDSMKIPSRILLNVQLNHLIAAHLRMRLIIDKLRHQLKLHSSPINRLALTCVSRECLPLRLTNEPSLKTHHRRTFSLN